MMRWTSRFNSRFQDEKVVHQTAHYMLLKSPGGSSYTCGNHHWHPGRYRIYEHRDGLIAPAAPGEDADRAWRSREKRLIAMMAELEARWEQMDAERQATDRADAEREAAKEAAKRAEQERQEKLLACLKQRTGHDELTYDALEALLDNNFQYLQGWNDAVTATVERLRGHQIDWMSDKSFGQMKGELLDAVKSLHRPTPDSISAKLQRDADSAQLHTRLLRHLSQAVTLRNRFLIEGWRRALRTRGFDDVVC